MASMAVALWSPAAEGAHLRPAYSVWRAGGSPRIGPNVAGECYRIRAQQGGSSDTPSGPSPAAAPPPGPPAGSRGGSSKCYLVGAGPGPADLLTVRAAELLGRADAVVYDDLGAAAAVDAYAPPHAERLYVGKRGGQPSIRQPEIDALLVAAAAAAPGRTVVRLKGGCPSVFSRVHSEIAALQAAGIEFELVPGVSSVQAAPLFAGFPLTHPQRSRAFAVASAHDPDALDWPVLAALDTLILLMGGSQLATIAERLQQAGRAASTPVAVVQSAALPAQRVWRGQLDGIVEQTAGERLSPCIIVVGDVSGGLL